MGKPLLIIISGPSCSGKSTLAKKISDKFNIPILSKDGIKVDYLIKLSILQIMVENEQEFSIVFCKIPNCTHTVGEKSGLVKTAPNGISAPHYRPIHVKNCDINPHGVDAAGQTVYDCDSYKPMNHA